MWDIDKIKKILPQKYPFLFIDRVIEINEKEGKITCLKNLTINDYFFEGHFPGNPIMPGALIIEAMAQASILLYATLRPHLAEKRPEYYLGRVEAAFKEPVRPGDQLILEARKEKIIDTAGIIRAFAKVGDKLVAEARIVFGVKVEKK